MSDRTWETTASPAVALAHVRLRLTEQSSRRAAVGFLHTVEHLIRTTRARTFFEKLDEYADGTLTRNQLEMFQYGLGPTPAETPHDDGRVGDILWQCGFPRRLARGTGGGFEVGQRSVIDLVSVSRDIALAAASGAAGHHPPGVHPDSPWHATFQTAWYEALATHADVIRCAFPTVLRRGPFDPAWRTSTAVAIASQARKTCDFSGMPVLADALQDAGCDDEEMLAHLRSRQGHHGCCWGVREVLGHPLD